MRILLLFGVFVCIIFQVSQVFKYSLEKQIIIYVKEDMNIDFLTEFQSSISLDAYILEYAPLKLRILKGRHDIHDNWENWNKGRRIIGWVVHTYKSSKSSGKGHSLLLTPSTSPRDGDYGLTFKEELHGTPPFKAPR